MIGTYQWNNVLYDNIALLFNRYDNYLRFKEKKITNGSWLVSIALLVEKSSTIIALEPHPTHPLPRTPDKKQNKTKKNKKKNQTKKQRKMPFLSRVSKNITSIYTQLFFLFYFLKFTLQFATIKCYIFEVCNIIYC